MPDSSFPEASFPNDFDFVIQTLPEFEQTARFSSLVESHQESWDVSLPNKVLDCRSEINSLLRPITFHADPLAPLRSQDELALEAIFEDTQVEEIFTDVYARLQQLYPEPCWEDDSFKFLSDYV